MLKGLKLKSNINNGNEPPKNESSNNDNQERENSKFLLKKINIQKNG